MAENEHRKGILHQTIVPARISPALAQAAQQAATQIAQCLAFVGVMAVEFFVTTTGELLVNEMAPRTHNSGHYTLDACITSQFEQQVRMVCELPFGDTHFIVTCGHGEFIRGCVARLTTRLVKFAAKP